MVGMPHTDRVAWAKESLLSELDVAIRNSLGQLPSDLDFDEVTELYKQRNRVAKLFGLAEIKAFSL